MSESTWWCGGTQLCCRRSSWRRLRECGLLASWCPQEEVLGHAAVGGFLTHSGWNSTLESIVGEVAMLSWPFFAEQQTNSRYACGGHGVGERDRDRQQHGEGRSKGIDKGADGERGKGEGDEEEGDWVEGGGGKGGSAGGLVVPQPGEIG
ncbi:hypothetical protein ZIOFF_066286 [Zingiber officinale]|uniref:Uncharacterized protein n=1 Tax=Zingiber officinale TaxID=94328 RepID=A0A8J5F328_ZINOF|nr:hypothetical protein ZIOFF_066286 [Zingiber officinale]